MVPRAFPRIEVPGPRARVGIRAATRSRKGAKRARHRCRATRPRAELVRQGATKAARRQAHRRSRPAKGQACLRPLPSGGVSLPAMERRCGDAAAVKKTVIDAGRDTGGDHERHSILDCIIDQAGHRGQPGGSTVEPGRGRREGLGVVRRLVVGCTRGSPRDGQPSASGAKYRPTTH